MRSNVKKGWRLILCYCYSNCLDSRINSYTLLPLIMAGENVGVELGPFNTKYAGLTQHMVNAQFPFHADVQGSWNSFLHMESEPGSTCKAGCVSCWISVSRDVVV